MYKATQLVVHTKSPEGKKTVMVSFEDIVTGVCARACFLLLIVRQKIGLISKNLKVNLCREEDLMA